MEDKIDISMPQNWNELSGAQLLQVCKLYGRELELTEFLSLAVFHLTGLKLIDKDIIHLIHKFSYRGKRITMDTFVFSSFCNAAKYLVETPGLSQQKIPYIRIWGRKYVGPADMLSNMTFGEWLQVDVYMQYYARTKEKRYLQLAVACMYRRVDSRKKRSGNYDGDPRQRFNEYLAEKNAKKFKWVPDHVLRAISIFFAGSMEALKSRFPLTLQESSGSGSRDLLKETLSMIDQLNNDDVTKNEAIQRTRLFEVLAKLENTRERAKRMEVKK